MPSVALFARQGAWTQEYTNLSFVCIVLMSTHVFKVICQTRCLDARIHRIFLLSAYDFNVNSCHNYVL